jgi:hypothetical protein
MERTAERLSGSNGGPIIRSNHASDSEHEEFYFTGEEASNCLKFHDTYLSRETIMSGDLQLFVIGDLAAKKSPKEQHIVRCLWVNYGLLFEHLILDSSQSMEQGHYVLLAVIVLHPPSVLCRSQFDIALL